MPSPFPGMDPYLEAPDIWPDFHFALAVKLSAELNHILPQSYYARIGQRPEMSSPDAPLQHRFVEIRYPSRGHALTTVIEFASPANKRRGDDRLCYEKKQREILQSETSLIELDLLRPGNPLIAVTGVRASAARLEPPPDYLVTVNRAWQRGAGSEYEVFPIRLEEPLPCIPVPLREGDEEPHLDLQYVFQQVYDGGPYARGAVDYDQPPDPPLRPELDGWLKACLKR